MKAAKVGEQQALGTAQKKWSANGKDIAALLSKANSNGSRRDLGLDCCRIVSTEVGFSLGQSGPLMRDGPHRTPQARQAFSHCEGYTHCASIARCLVSRGFSTEGSFVDGIRPDGTIRAGWRS